MIKQVWRGLLVLVSLIGGLTVALSGQANTGSILASNNYTTVGVGTAQSLLSVSGVSCSSYPNMMNVSANNLSGFDITNQTTQFTVTVNGTLTAKNNAFTFNGIYLDLMDSSGNILSSTAAKNLVTTTGQSSYTFDNTVNQTLNMTWSSWKGTTPLWIGLRYVTSKNQEVRVGLASIAAYQVSLSPTISSGLFPNTTVIKGTGTMPGDTITADADSSAKATVGSDLSYTLSLSSALGSKSNVTVTESDNNGHTGTVTQPVQSALTIAATTPKFNLAPSDAANLASQSDANVLAWLVQQGGVTATDPNSSSSSGITYATKTTGLGGILGGLAIGSSTTINVYATNSAGNTSNSVALTVTRMPGTLSFQTVTSAVDFGSQTIPLTETVYQPTSAFNVSISDTRDAGKNWYVYASAPALTSGSQQFKGSLIYRNGSTQQALNAGMTLIASGSKASGTTNTTVTSDWSSTKGIMLDALPGIYAGSYSTTVNWTLADTPN